MSGWIRKQDPSDESRRKTHDCPVPQIRDGDTDDASLGDLWKCNCTEVWELVPGGYLSRHEREWESVDGIRGWYLRRYAKVTIPDE